MAQISPARKAAFQILMAVERGQSHSDDLLRGKAVNALSAPDRNLATALVLGVLRWQIQLDHQIRALLSHPNAKLDPEIRIALRLGAFQLLHMDRIPARAVLSESVELAKQAGHHFASGMVNAVLRKLATRSQSVEKEIRSIKKRQGTTGRSGLQPRLPQMQQNEPRALAPEGSCSDDLEAHPAWMVERWTNVYSLDAARSICRHGQSQPVPTIRLANPAVEAELLQAGIVLKPGQLLTAARTVVSGDVTTFLKDRVRLQDEGSQLVAELTSANPNQKILRILDCCAAPGGKTLILAQRNPEARIVVMESSAPRLAQLQQRLATHTRIECRLADATVLTEDSAFDLALADVPCSGTGTLGRNPEIRHRLRPDDLSRHAERQRAILAAALRAVRPGGSVVYSTCSLEPEENEQVVAAILTATPDARLVPLNARIQALLGAGILTENGAERLSACFTPEGALRLLPGAFNTDGFFIALIEKTA
ncbi:MAG: transcription antitermination factor NusB [Terracidiphilus sp.]|jgi:16S rRNA (cytosine967-C5)-methyltransferase